MKKMVMFAAMICCTAGLVAQTPAATGPAASEPSIYIDTDPNFQTALAAALVKKHDPVRIVTDKEQAGLRFNGECGKCPHRVRG